MDSRYKTPGFSRRAASLGFTLIELSIVIVIIGLIVGGVLVGRELVKAAQIRATIKQFEDFNIAANTFKIKYNCLPGDCANASNFGFDASADGNGDGRVGPCLTGCYDSNSPNHSAQLKEYIDFWYHLSAAGLIPYSFKPFSQLTLQEMDGGRTLSGVVTPAAKIKPVGRWSGTNKQGQGSSRNISNGWMVRGAMTLTPDASGVPSTLAVLPSHSLLLGSGWEPSGITVTNDFHGGFLPSDVEAIDRKIDDGFPLSGSMQIYGYYVDATLGTSVRYFRTTPPDDPVTCDIPRKHCVCGVGFDLPPYYYDVKSQFTTAFQRGCPFAIRASF